MHQHLLDLKIGMRFLQELKHLTEMQEYVFIPLNKDGSGELPENGQKQSVIGFKSQDAIYILPEKSFEVIRTLIDIGSNRKALSIDLKLEGITESDREGSGTYRIRVNGERKSLYKVRTDIWESIE